MNRERPKQISILYYHRFEFEMFVPLIWGNSPGRPDELSSRMPSRLEADSDVEGGWPTAPVINKLLQELGFKTLHHIVLSKTYSSFF